MKKKDGDIEGRERHVRGRMGDEKMSGRRFKYTAKVTCAHTAIPSHPRRVLRVI